MSTKKIDIILLRDVKNLGKRFTQISVAPSYAKNVLIPQGVALIATPQVLNQLGPKIADAHKKKEEKSDSLDDIFVRLKNLKHITIEATTTPMGNFYHKIEKKDIIELLFKHVHYKFATKSISGDFPFGQLGNFAIKIKEQGREATVQCTITAKK